jgi:hypothetical protein
MTVVDENSGSIVSPQTTPLEAKKESYENEKDIIFARITPCMKNRKVATKLMRKYHYGPLDTI